MTKHLKTLVFFLFQLLLINSALFSTSSIASSTEIGNSTKVVQNIPRPNFNHDSTTFQLLGAHRGLECNKCHLAGRYKGTPRNCSDCHNGQITYGKPADHIMTTQACTLCHSQNSWLPTTFTHDASSAGQCSTCHNGQKATGKSANHISTNSQCDTCHRTSAWIPAGFNHANLGNQLCSSCHKAGGTGMAPTSDAVHSNLGGQDCKSCHASTTTFTTLTMNHTGIVAPCSTCHATGNTVGAMVKPSNHMATTQECSSCHAGTSTFANGIFNHSGLTGQLCSSCHKSGGTGMAPKSDVVHSNLGGQDCKSCHSGTVTFTGSTMNHAGIVIPCSTCHIAANAVGAMVKPSNHMVTTQECNLCHAGTSTFANGIFNHSGLTGQLCSSCHKSGGSGMAPKSDVVHSNLGGQDCSSCHTGTVTFTGSTMNHAGIVAACSTCHYVGNSVGAVAKSSNHMTTTQECNLCHAGTSTFANGIFNHSSLTGQLCSSCHKSGGSGMAPKSDVVHSNLGGQDCSSCHASTTTFTTATMNHAGVVAACSTCHYVGNSVGAVAKSSNHMATTQECNLCHAGTTTFANGVFNHSTLTGQLCNSCHKTGGSGMAPKNDVVHSNLAGQDCKSCHASTTTFTTATMNHTGIVAVCSTCHSVGNAVGAVAKPSNHMVTTQECNLCHAGTATFANGIFNHSTLTGQLCNSCHKTGGSGMAPKNDVVHSNLNGKDCNGCHSSTTTFTTVTMNHTGISPPTSCATCHIAGNTVGAVSTPNPHPYAAANSDCSQCHTGFTTFSGASFNHTGVTTCKTCHFAGNTTGAMAPPMTAGNLIHNPLSNIITDCNSCHTSTQSGGFSSYRMVHTAILNYATTCQNCHKSGNPMGAEFKSNHNVGVICGNCHSTSTFDK